MKKKEELFQIIYSEVLKCKKYFKIDECRMKDYVHDAFIKVVEKMDVRYEEIGKLKAWIRTVAMNYIKTRIKRDNAIQFCAIDDIHGQRILSYDGGHRNIKRKVVVEFAVEALESLPPEDSEMFSRKVDGRSFQKLADELKYNVKTVRRHVEKSRDIMVCIITKKYFQYYNEDFNYCDI